MYLNKKSNFSEKSLFLPFCGIKYIDFLRPNTKNNYLSRNLMNEIYVFDIYSFLTLIIIIFSAKNIKSNHFWRPYLLNI